MSLAIHGLKRTENGDDRKLPGHFRTCEKYLKIAPKHISLWVAAVMVHGTYSIIKKVKTVPIWHIMVFIVTGDAIVDEIIFVSNGRCGNLSTKEGFFSIFPCLNSAASQGDFRARRIVGKMKKLSREVKNSETFRIYKEKDEEIERQRETPWQMGLGRFVVTQRRSCLGATTVNGVWQAHP